MHNEKLTSRQRMYSKQRKLLLNATLADSANFYHRRTCIRCTFFNYLLDNLEQTIFYHCNVPLLPSNLVSKIATLVGWVKTKRKRN